jgi:energy-coupling factor transporter ATP-binding protein EcfA2
MKARENPFAVERIQAIRYRPLDTTIESLVARLQELRYRAALVGPEGSGKTTLLEDLQQVLARRGFPTRLIFVNDTAHLDRPACQRLLAELTPDRILLLDGADLLRRWDWSRIKRGTLARAGGLVVTAHHPGLLPTLLECSTSPALLETIVDELQPHPVTPVRSLNDLYERHQGNLRECLRELYDLYAQT